jgi:hypothetical protein
LLYSYGLGSFLDPDIHPLSLPAARACSAHTRALR